MLRPQKLTQWESDTFVQYLFHYYGTPEGFSVLYFPDIFELFFSDQRLLEEVRDDDALLRLRAQGKKVGGNSTQRLLLNMVDFLSGSFFKKPYFCSTSFATSWYWIGLINY